MRNSAVRFLPVILLVTASFAQLPPLIDREVLFDDPEISGAQISPDGKYIAFMKPLNKTRNVWVKETPAPFESARPITADTKRPIPAFFWSRDGKYILFVQDQAGDENFNVYAVNPADKPAGGQQVPSARNLTDAKGVRAQIYAVPKTDPDTIYVGLNDRDKAWHDLYKVKISTGESTLLRKNTDRLVFWVFDNKDQLRLAYRVTDPGENQILRVDPDGFKTIYTCGVFENCVPVRFHKDDRRVYLQTNKGGNIDLQQLELLDPATGKTEFVEADPQKRVDLAGAMISDLTKEIIATIYVDDKLRYSWKNKDFEADYNRLQKQIPGSTVRFVSSTTDERLWLVTAAKDTEPGQTWLYDRNTKNATLQYKIREKLPREHLTEMKPIRYESAGGLEIPAYLTLPKGVEAKNLPVVVVPHGGPWGRDVWGYSGLAQFLANRGYAVLQPNFRASVGYGKKFLDLGNNQWGQTMQDDITWGVKHLVAKGIADPKRVGIMGGSYGGYATLAGLAFTPDLFAAGVDIVGPSNLMTLLDTIPPYWESGRTQLYKRVGDPRTPEGKAQLEKQSPLNSASKIKAPLLVVQGANDPRVKQAESDQIVIALREHKLPVEYLIATDEGHGFARPVNNMAMYAAAEKFLAKHIGGRYQESMTPEVATRLREITVDPKTVVLAKKVDPSSVGLPKVAAALNPGIYKYLAKIQMGERVMNMNTTTDIRQDGDLWRVTDKASTPMGEISDETVLDGKSLVVINRSTLQGPMHFKLQMKDNKVTGSMKMQDNEKPIDVDAGGPIFADGPGTWPVIATLPLADGYAATYRNFDMMKQKAKLMQLKVAGSEKVSVAAGEFDAWKLDISSAEGGPEKMTVWIAKDSRKPVKSTGVLAAANGATITVELQ
jgi:dipeptidyl aminopeptidase/acylaminoacyl peptidase